MKMFMVLAHQSVAAAGPLEFPGSAWSPYLVGALIGVLSWLTFAISNKALGASSSYAAAAGGLGRLVAPRHTAGLEYYQSKPPALNWGVALAVGIVIGAWLAASTGGELSGRWLPPYWAATFGGDSLWLRAGFGLAGGILMAFGARLAGGCTSGHGISGTLQLGVGSWLAAACFFIGGTIVAHMIYQT